MYFSYRIFSDKMPNKIIRRSVHSQSYFYDVVKIALPIIDMLKPKPEKVSQSFKEQKKHTLRILTLGDRAYWIKDNAVHEAAIVDGHIDGESTKVLDTTAMDDVELKKMIFIVDKLTEGTQE